MVLKNVVLLAELKEDIVLGILTDDDDDSY